MGKGTEDRAKGTWDKAKGKVKEEAGEATGDRDMEREGRMDQAKGAGKRAVGSVKDAAGKVKEDVKDAGDKLTEGAGGDDRYGGFPLGTAQMRRPRGQWHDLRVAAPAPSQMPSA